MIRDENFLKNNKYITRDPEGTLQTRGINTRQNDMLALYYLALLFLSKGNPYNSEDDKFVAMFKRERSGFMFSKQRDMYEKYLIGENKVGIWPNWKTCTELTTSNGEHVIETIYQFISKLIRDSTKNIPLKEDSAFDHLAAFYAGDNNRIYIKVEEILKDIYETSVSTQSNSVRGQLAQNILDTLETYFHDLDLRAQQYNREYRFHRQSLNSQNE